ncbi:MAG: hypothetical protein AAF331_12485, partial [Pseudomonadota bacterium]
LIGLIFIALAAASVFRSQMTALAVMGVAALFQAATVMDLGMATIPPGHVTLAFFILAVILRVNGLGASVSALVYPRAGFFLSMVVAWAVISGFVLPRVFAGMVQVIPLNLIGDYFVQVPLFPRSSNLNQSVYFIGNLCAFLFVFGMMKSPGMLKKAAGAGLIICAAHMAIAMLDSFTFAIGQPNLLDFMRNAGYSQLFGATVMGMKRMTGSFTEASAFSAMAIGLFAFAFRLWRGGIYTKWSGPLSIALAFGVILAFSSTGFVAFGVYFIVTYSLNLVSNEGGAISGARSRRMFFVSLAPIGALAVAVLVAVRPDVLDPVVELFDSSIATKLSSASGQERMAWNLSGISNFFNTYGLGVGLGSVRTSSFLVSVPANLGLIGVLLFGAFFYQLFFSTNGQRWGRIDPESAQIVAAARSSCFALLIAAAVSSSTMDLGLVFHIMAGIACSSPAYFLSQNARRPMPESGLEYDTVGNVQEFDPYPPPSDPGSR